MHVPFATTSNDTSVTMSPTSPLTLKKPTKYDQQDIESNETATESSPTAYPKPTVKLTCHSILHYLWSVYLSKSFSQLIVSINIYLFSIYFPINIAQWKSAGLPPHCLYRDSLNLKSLKTPIKEDQNSHNFSYRQNQID